MVAVRFRPVSQYQAAEGLACMLHAFLVQVKRFGRFEHRRAYINSGALGFRLLLIQRCLVRECTGLIRGSTEG